MSGLDTEDLKDELRDRIRERRDRRPADDRSVCAAAFAHMISSQPLFQSARCIAGYVSVNAEPGSEPILELARSRGIRVLLPVLGPGLTRDWALDGGPTTRIQAAPGRPPEPQSAPLGAEAIAQADLIIAPALSVDSRGVRLGQGGGWYDRALRHAAPSTLVVAMVYDEEFTDLSDERSVPLPREEHDRLVNAVVTPTRWLWLTPNGLA